METISPTASATGNDHQTPSKSQSLLNRYAIGIRTNSCLIIDVIIVPIPKPVAWKVDESPMEIAAKEKH